MVNPQAVVTANAVETPAAIEVSAVDAEVRALLDELGELVWKALADVEPSGVPDALLSVLDEPEYQKGTTRLQQIAVPTLDSTALVTPSLVNFTALVPVECGPRLRRGFKAGYAQLQLLRAIGAPLEEIFKSAEPVDLHSLIRQRLLHPEMKTISINGAASGAALLAIAALPNRPALQVSQSALVPALIDYFESGQVHLLSMLGALVDAMGRRDAFDKVDFDMAELELPDVARWEREVAQSELGRRVSYANAIGSGLRQWPPFPLNDDAP